MLYVILNTSENRRKIELLSSLATQQVVQRLFQGDPEHSLLTIQTKCSKRTDIHKYYMSSLCTYLRREESLISLLVSMASVSCRTGILDSSNWITLSTTPPNTCTCTTRERERQTLWCNYCCMVLTVGRQERHWTTLNLLIWHISWCLETPLCHCVQLFS